MADNVPITAGSGTSIATDDAGAGGHVQIIKLAVSADGSATVVPADATTGLLVNTELPTGAALADAAANPTAPMVGASNQVWNGTTWDLARGHGSGFLGTSTATGVPAASVVGTDSGGVFRSLRVDNTGGVQVFLNRGSPITDGASVLQLEAGQYAWNGATWDRWRANFEGTALASSARTASTNSANITNYNGRGIVVYLNVTAVSGAGTLTVKLEGIDPVSSTAGEVGSAAAAVTATGISRYVFYPGADAIGTVATSTASAGVPLPRTFRVRVVHGTADSMTYSVGYAVIV